MATGVICAPPILQFTLNNGQLAAGGSVLTQVGGINAATFQDVGLTTPLPNPINLNSRGEIANAAGASCQLFLTPNTVYTFTLFDGPNGTGNQVWLATYVNGVQVSLTQAAIGLALYPQTSAESAAGVTPTNYAYPPGDVRRYGGDPLGVIPADTAWTSNVAQAGKPGGSEMVGPGSYLLSTGIVIAADGVKLRTTGMGPTTFKANANNIILLKIASSYCTIGSFNVDANGRTGVEGLVLAPVDETNTTSLSQINFNEFGAIQLLNGLKEGIRMRAGPTVGGFDSGIFYNAFSGVWVRDCIRAIWMQDSIGGGHGLASRNTFMAVRGGSSGIVINTGIQIDCGGTNKFFGLDMEGIQNGTVPNAVPTAIKVANVSAIGANNSDNHFFGSFLEANTRDLDNTCSSTCFFGGSITATKCQSAITISTITISGATATVTTAAAHGLQTSQQVRMIGQTPAAFSGTFVITVTGANTFAYTVFTAPGGNATVVGAFDVLPRTVQGIDPSQYPLLMPGMQYGEGVPGLASGYWGLTREFADLNYSWQTYALSTSVVTNAATIAAGALSKFRRLGNMVSWHGAFNFNATTAATQITIAPPLVPNAALYSTLAATNAFYAFYVEDGTGIRKPVEGGWTSGGSLYIKAPSTTWNTGGNNNAIWFAIEFHI